jgi:rhamnopyranosyl-N-acetylglucosaminyl-diphospho-decaprenol beta-1,3/1,4-galactofuranosyltransferase
MKNTVAAVVVTFNRKQLLTECLDALLSQTHAVEKIIVIDNASTDGTPEYLKEKLYLEHSLIEYIRLSENTGGAGGFYAGTKRAYELGYEWIWLMDDDAEPYLNALETLAKHFGTVSISALASTVKDAKGISLTHRGIINFEQVFPTFHTIHKPLNIGCYNNKNVEIDMASFVGILINRHSIHEVGFPKKEFFIHHDDVEYCIRLRQAGKILLITDSIILHKEQSKNSQAEVNFMGKNFFKVPYEKFWLTYFGKRNLVWIGKKYAKSKVVFYLSIFRIYLRAFLEIILFNDHKLNRTYCLVESYRDGLKGNFNNFKSRHILYKEPL